MTTPPPHQPADLLHLLTRAERLLTRRLTGILDAAGSSVDAWRVMCLLSDGTGHPMTEVAGQVFLPPATLTKLVDHMVDDNVVYRRVDDLDRRRIRAYLTPRGRNLYKQVREQLDASVVELPTDDGDQARLAELLTALVEALGGPATAKVGAGTHMQSSQAPAGHRHAVTGRRS